MYEKLITTGEFFSLSLQSAEIFSKPQSFVLPNSVNVNILGPGIIVFDVDNTAKKHIILSCGIHGNETAPIEICDELVKNILTGKIKPAHKLMFIFGNLPAIKIGKRFVEENLNRLFCGEHTKGEKQYNAERKRAKELEQAVALFFSTSSQSSHCLHYDLHTAIRESKNEKFAVYPFLHGKKHSAEQLAMMAECDVKTVLLSSSPSPTFSYHSSFLHGAHAFTVELGKAKPFGENDMSRFEKAKSTLLKLIESSTFLPTASIANSLIYKVNQVINRTKEDFALHFNDDTPNFADFNKGDILASESGATYVAQFDGEAIVFPNAQVALGQRALLTVVPTSIE